MEVRIKVRTGRKSEGVVPLPDGRYEVSVAEKPEGGRANERVRGIIARHFCVSTRAVKIVKGTNSRFKTLSIKSEKSPV